MITPQYLAEPDELGRDWCAYHRVAGTPRAGVWPFLSGRVQNGTDGTIKVAIDAINAAGAPHCFLSVTKWGHSAIVNTSGNDDCHIILRGGKEPNYSAQHISSEIRPRKIGFICASDDRFQPCQLQQAI